MDPGFLFAADAERNGTGRHVLARRCRSGELVRVRPGVYVETGLWKQLPRWERDRARITAAIAQGRSPRVLIQQSAAVIWGLPVIGSAADVLLLAAAPSHGRRRGNLCWTHRRLLEPVTRMDGLLLTSRAQTVVDMAAYLPFDRAVPATDHVLRPDPLLQLPALKKEILRALAAALPDNAKRTRALRVIEFADPLAESPGESYSRAVMHRHGFPPPELQHEFFSSTGQLLGRTDFYWKEQAVVGEFDGAVKYGAAATASEAPWDTLLREKRREDAIRATGAGFIRWSWADISKPLNDPDSLVQRLSRAGLPRTLRRS